MTQETPEVEWVEEPQERPRASTDLNRDQAYEEGLEQVEGLERESGNLSTAEWASAAQEKPNQEQK